MDGTEDFIAFLETAEADLSTQASAIDSALEFIKCVKEKVLPALNEAQGHLSGSSAEKFEGALKSVTFAVQQVMGEISSEQVVSVLAEASEPAESTPSVSFGINAVSFALLQSMLTQEKLPTTLEELAKARWGTDWKKQEFTVGRAKVPVPEDIASPDKSHIGELVARSVYRIRLYLTDSMPAGSIPYHLLIQAANLVKEQGLDEVESIINSSWGVTYPPDDTGQGLKP